ncbi:IPTL-CTERM sorting domain-containing protein [Zoogloea sp.]|uniref:IPTL-CTERM sorting domain-containing protein n=1 Tax=Zoogloea sp. TaxID=49181 RepID=UPI001416E352|nr:MAG: IPTL-CTERM sorting domain-containing protein [Zoogloea sp.]
MKLKRFGETTRWLAIGVSIIAGMSNYSLAHAATTTFSYSGPAVPIPDGVDLSGSLPGAEVGAPIAVSGLTGLVGKVTLSIDGTACSATEGSTTVGIDHTYVNDLGIKLRSPTGTEVVVILNTDGSGNNLCQVVLDDAAPTSIQTAVTAQAPFTGTWAPNAPLSAFAGQSANGTWTLLAQDFFSNDIGSIRAWSITITDAVPIPTAIPTLSQWGMLILSSLLAFGSVVLMRRRR